MMNRRHPYAAGEPLQKTRAIEGQVLPMPCDNVNCPAFEIINDEPFSLSDLLEAYRGCIVRFTIELVELPPSQRGQI